MRGRLRVALVLVLLGGAAQAEQLVVSLAGSGTELARFAVADGARWSILWHHSVQGFEVEDIYENRHGILTLVRSHLPDFAAGLDHIPGRGRQVTDHHGGYWIEDLDEPVPGNAYILRPGRRAVNHRLRTADAEISLSAMAEHAHVRIALEPDTLPRDTPPEPDRP